MTITRTVTEELRVFGFTVPPQGQTYTVRHGQVYRVVDGRVREHWAVRDDFGMLRRLGAID
jgi:predicted ester cyclase